MTVFFIVAAALTVAALLFVVPPLLRRDSAAQESVERLALNVAVYRDQLAELDQDLRSGTLAADQHQRSRDEIERRLLEEAQSLETLRTAQAAKARPVVAVVVAVIVPVTAVGLYLHLGNPQGMHATQRAPVNAAAGAPGQNAQDQIQEMVRSLAERLEQEPQDTEGWAMLARSYYVMGKTQEAVQAFEKAQDFVQTNANLLTDYADALAMVSSNSLQGQPLQMVLRALELDPQNQKALWLAGTAEFDQGNYLPAIGHWQRLLDMLPPQSNEAKSMRASIAEARALAEGRLPAPGAAMEEQSMEAPPAVSTDPSLAIDGRVELSADLAANAAPGDVLYVFARANNESRMPVAIVRASVSDLPLSFTLDDAKSVMPNLNLSQFTEVQVVARISKSGDAIAKAGDLEGSAQAVRVGARDVKVVIDRVVQ